MMYGGATLLPPFSEYSDFSSRYAGVFPFAPVVVSSLYTGLPQSSRLSSVGQK